MSLTNCQLHVIFLQLISCFFHIILNNSHQKNMTASLIKKRVFVFVLCFASLVLGHKTFAQADGKTLFSNLCASCHNPYKKATGPAMYGALTRQPDEKLMKAWIKNNEEVKKSGNKYYTDLTAEYGGTAMTVFAGTPDADIDAIVKYIKELPPPPVATEAKKEEGKADGGNNLLIGLITLTLGILALILLQVNSSLKKLTDVKKGIPSVEPIPFWRNTSYLSIIFVALSAFGGYKTTVGAIESGRSKDYQPVQPIYYSHKVHAGTNQINCLYCHSGAEQGKHANIPSVNVCMNCHKGIQEYAGEKIISEDGNEIDGTAEIQKLYAYAGYDPKNLSTWQVSDIKKPIEWVRIHNLPDHVYFNHAQHVKAGKVQCQTCHGQIQEMGEVKQHSDLSMGWCINCHRETKVQFKENNYYAGMYEKWYNDIKGHTRDSSVTVEMIGGTECQKCHY
jgi:cytochrome c553